MSVSWSNTIWSTGCASCGAVELDGVDQDAGLFSVSQLVGAVPLGNRAVLRFKLTAYLSAVQASTQGSEHSRLRGFMSYGVQA